MGFLVLVDRGGTFTDVVSRGPDGAVEVHKLLSQDVPDDDPVVTALAGREVDELRLGTTVATNTLLERTGAPVRLVVTAGFGDLLAIGDQARPDLFALEIRARAPLVAEVVELDERILADGTVRRRPDEDAIRRALRGAEHVAVVLLHAWAYPEHERLVASVAASMGVPHVTLSHRIAPQIGVLARADTTVADAYLTPRLLASVLPLATRAGRVLCMQSNGGLTEAADFAGRHAVLSGPAGGVVATAEVARLAGFDAAIGFDMGGTSTDVCRVQGRELPRVYESVVDGVRLRVPTLDIVTVAAGGGSRLARRDGRLVVGPESAGADPGPACYGRGGPATLTDAQLVLGRIRADWFPHLTLDAQAARERLAALGDPEEVAAGCLAIAVENMASAIRTVSVARGHDVRGHALVSFGGAGGQCACAVARRLGMPHVLVHPFAGVLSAWGLGLADVEAHAVAPVAPGSTDPDFPEEEARGTLARRGAERATVRRLVDVRYAGTDSALTIPWSGGWRAAFEAAHRALFGFVQPDRRLEIVAARAEAVAPVERLEPPPEPVVAHTASPRRVVDGGLALHVRADLRPGATFDGPAVVVEDHATTVVEAGWRARVDGHGMLVLEDGAGGGPTATPSTIPGRRLGTERDPVGLEIMSNLFMSIAEQMGEHLRRVAHSTNMKERLDFSCALFDADGHLVANAPHIPVHLGAMGETVRGLLARQSIEAGDVWLLNDPYRGGSHLPDLTLVTPVMREGRRVAFVANRGHHADVGGIQPGSMPAESTRLEEEGLLIQDELLVRDGELRSESLEVRMRAAGVRDLEERFADLRAQIACNVAGERLVQEACDRLGADVLAAWMAHVQDHGEEVLEDVVATLEGGAMVDHLDDGTPLAVSVRVRDGRASVDFSGTGPQHPGNRNAPRAVVVSAVLYVFRVLARHPIPLNDGCLRVLDIVVPEGSLLDPRPPAAVVGGNVETSQRLVDLLLGALGVLSGSQGTMNNLTLGDEHGAYYETICGGAGAGLGFDGASAVHTHMTNTRITDAEVLEQRHPVVVRRFAIRRGSGGEGVWRGGDGVVRELELLRPQQVSVLAEHRRRGPVGIGAHPGQPGAQRVGPGRVTVWTPGGGGYGPSTAEWAAMSPAAARALFRSGRWRRGTTGISVSSPRAWLFVVDAEAAGATEDVLSERHVILHRGAPGDPLVAADLASPAGGTTADLSTDLPWYVRRPAGSREIVAEAGHIAFGPGDVAFLVAADRSGREPAPPPADHWTGAPGRLFLADVPAGPRTP